MENLSPAALTEPRMRTLGSDLMVRVNADKLKEAAALLSMSQNQVANLSGLTQAEISRLFTKKYGSANFLSEGRAKRIAEALGMTIDEIALERMTRSDLQSRTQAAANQRRREENASAARGPVANSNTRKEKRLFRRSKLGVLIRVRSKDLMNSFRASGKNLKEIAAESGIPVASVGRYISPGAKVLKTDRIAEPHLIALCKALDIPMASVIKTRGRDLKPDATRRNRSRKPSAGLNMDAIHRERTRPKLPAAIALPETALPPLDLRGFLRDGSTITITISPRKR